MLKLHANLNRLIYGLMLRRRKPRTLPHKTCGIFKVDGLGDMVLALEAIRAVVREYGVDHCVLICWRRASELVRMEFPGLEIIEADLPGKSLLKTLVFLWSQRNHPVFAQGVDILVSLRHHRSMHNDLLVSAIPAAKTVGSPSSKWPNFQGELVKSSRLVFDEECEVPPANGEGECTEITWNRAVVGRFLPRAATAPQGRWLNPPAEVRRNPSLLVVAPFAGQTIRDLDAGQLGRVLPSVVGRLGIECAVVCSRADQHRGETLVHNLGLDGGIKVVLRMTNSLSDLVKEIAGAGLFFGPESGPAHLAIAMDVPTVALLGGGHYGWFAPWRRNENQVWLTNRLPCFECGWQCQYPEAFCLTQISDDQIASAIERGFKKDGMALSVKEIRG